MVSNETVEMAKRITPWIDENPVFWLEDLRKHLFGSTCSDANLNKEIPYVVRVIRLLVEQEQIIPSMRRKGKQQYMKLEEFIPIVFSPIYKSKKKRSRYDLPRKHEPTS